MSESLRLGGRKREGAEGRPCTARKHHLKAKKQKNHGPEKQTSTNSLWSKGCRGYSKACPRRRAPGESFKQGDNGEERCTFFSLGLLSRSALFDHSSSVASGGGVVQQSTGDDEALGKVSLRHVQPG